MARIPARTLVSPRFSGNDIPSGVFERPGRAMAELINTVGGAADEVLKHVREAQETRNQMNVRDEVRKMRELQSQFYQDMERDNVDPAEWVDLWRDRLNSHQNNIKQAKYPPKVLEALDQQFTEFSGSSLLTISGAALKENRRLAKGSWNLDYKDAKERGDIPRMRSLVEEGRELLDPLELKAAEMDTELTAEKTSREMDMIDDPIGHVKRLEKNEYNLSPSVLQEELKRAKAYQAQEERQEVQNIRIGIDNGTLDSVEKLDKELELYPNITEPMKKLLRKQVEDIDPLSYEEKFGVADSIRDDFRKFKAGELSLEEYTERHNRNQMKVDAYGNRKGAGPLKSLAYRYDPVHYTGDEGTEEDARKKAKKVAETREDRGKEMIRTRALGAVKTKVAAKRTELRLEGEETTTPELVEFETKEKQFALLFRAAMEDELARWLEDQPDDKPPSVPDMEAYLNKIQPGVIQRIINERKESAKKAVEASARRTANPDSSSPESDYYRRAADWESYDPARDFDPDMVLPPR